MTDDRTQAHRDDLAFVAGTLLAVRSALEGGDTTEALARLNSVLRGLGTAQRKGLSFIAGTLTQDEPPDLPTLRMRDEAAWREAVAKNDDPYGACTVRYAARWAHLIESRLADGAQLADVAEATAREADTEGVTGAMYGMAVALLARCWWHGEDLRRWHNRATQIGDEGERANAAGTVLNPAMLVIGGG